MKRKSLFLSIAVIMVLVAVYIIWHFSPLRYLTQSDTGFEQPVIAAVDNRSRPVIVTKKIRSEPENSQQTGDLPRPLVVLKKIKPEQTSETAPPQVEIEIPAVEEKKTASPAPEVSSSAEMTQQQPAAADKPVEPPQLTAQKVAASQPDSYHPYSIMLSSCRLPRSARKVVSDYKKAGLAPYVVKVKFESGEEWLRVLTGHYQTRREAVRAKKEHQLKSAIVKRTPYANLIGTYASPDEMQADLVRIKKLGYSPYFLKTSTGELKLMVGAFFTKETADDHQAELQAKGIQNTVVIR